MSPRKGIGGCVPKSQTEKIKEKDVTNSTLFQRVLQLMLIFARWEGVRGPFVLVCGILGTPLVVHIFVYLGKLCTVRHAKSAGFLLSFHSWNVHDSVKEHDMCDFLGFCTY